MKRSWLWLGVLVLGSAAGVVIGIAISSAVL